MDLKNFYKRLRERDLEDINRWKNPEVQPILAELIEAFNLHGDLDLIHSKLPFVDEYDDVRDFRGAPLLGLNVNDRNFHEFKFDFADMRGARFTGCRFSHCTFIDANLAGSIFIECWFKYGVMNANLENANLTGSTFLYTNLHDASLKNANFTNVNLGGITLVGCDLTNTIFTGADLSGCEIVKSREMVNPRVPMMQDLMTSDTALSLDDLRKLLKRLEGESHNIFTNEDLRIWISLYHYFQDKLYHGYHQKFTTMDE
jgi:uncharacterized protein YjbI with pentapeptide repeats